MAALPDLNVKIIFYMQHKKGSRGVGTGVSGVKRAKKTYQSDDEVEDSLLKKTQEFLVPDKAFSFAQRFLKNSRLMRPILSMSRKPLRWSISC